MEERGEKGRNKRREGRKERVGGLNSMEGGSEMG